MIIVLTPDKMNNVLYGNGEIKNMIASDVVSKMKPTTDMYIMTLVMDTVITCIIMLSKFLTVQGFIC